MSEEYVFDLEKIEEDDYVIKKFGKLDRSRLFEQYKAQNGGFLVSPVFLSDPVTEDLKSIEHPAEDENNVFANISQFSRSAKALHFDVEVSASLSNDEWIGFWEIPDQFCELVRKQPVTLIEIWDGNSTPGLHPLGRLLGKKWLLENYWDAREVNLVLLAGQNIEWTYRKKKSDDATRYLYQQHDVQIYYTDPTLSSDDFRLEQLPDLDHDIHGKRISANSEKPSQESKFPAEDATGEDRVLNWYYENCLEKGKLFREFNVTNMIENSGRRRALDGLMIRSDEDGEIYKPTLSNGGYRYAYHMIQNNHPVTAVEVHKWGLEGLGQLLGKAQLLDEFWSPNVIRKVFVVKNNQGRRFERLDRKNPQLDLEGIMDDFGIEVVIAPDDI